MDYDDNNNQGYNRKVAGESRSNSSSVLRPYAFPRFDIDDSLQGHLRFDNLVETDVFLGIRSQDDNQWIEDFSRGSDGIEFSSSATESCSIARKNNVCSEATSSESVEMLLKSVGQEQIPPKDTVCENRNTSNESGGLQTEMEPIFEQDDVIGGSTSIPNVTMLQDGHLNSCSEPENHVEGKLSQVVEISSSQEKVVEDHGSSSQTHPNDLEEECKLLIPEGVLFPGTECDDKNGQEAECSFDVCLDQTGDGLSQSNGPAKVINSSSRILVSAHSSDQVSSHGEGIDALVRATGDGIKVQLASEEMAHLDTQIIEQHKLGDAVCTEVSHSFSSSVECLDKQTDIEVIIKTNESLMMSCAEERQFQLLEGRSEDNSLTSPTLPGRGQTVVLSTSRVINATSTDSDFLTENPEQHATKLSNLNARYCSSSGAKLDSVEESDKKLSSAEVDNMTENSHGEGGPGNEALVSCCQSSLIKGENNPSTDKISNADIGELGESLGCPVSSSSAGLSTGRDGAESIKDLHDASAVNVKGSRSSGYKEDFQVEADMQSNARETEDISVEIKKEENFSLSTSGIDASPRTFVSPTSDQGPSAMMRNMSYDEPVVKQPHSENACKIETEANLILHKNNIVEGNNEDVHKQPFVREISDADVNERSCGRMSVAVSLSNLDGSVQVAAEVDSTCKSKSVIHHDSTPSQLSGADGKVTPVMETCNVASGSEPPSANSNDCLKRSEVHPDRDDSVLNKDPQKLECNSPTIISSVVLSPDESQQEGDGGSEYAENKPSASEDLKGKDTPLDDNNFTFKVNLSPNVEREKANTWAPFPIVETYKSSVVLEGVATPDTDKIQARLPQETSGSNPGDHKHGMSKATSGRKRRTSGKGVAKENLQKKGVNMMETTPDRPSHKEDIFSVSFSSGSSLPGQFEGSHSHGLTKHKSKKLSTKNVVPTSNLPDLNASALKNNASPSTTVQQPFTQLQQVQLWAQIFVYGSLIQWTAPNEACMISAFASSDRGRDVWEPVWQAALGRGRSKKSQPASGSPMNSHSSGVKVPDVACKHVSPETKVFPSPVSRSSSKGTPTTILSPIIPLSSPLWSISTPYHDVSRLSNLQGRPVLHYQPAISPLQPYQTSPVQNIIGHTTRQSQVPCSPSPWALQTSALNVNARFSTTAITETVKLTPVKGFSLPAPSSVKDVPSPPLVNTDTTSTVFAKSSQTPVQTKGSLPSEMSSAGSKPRRRKKAQPSNNTAQNPFLSQAQMKMVVASSLTTLASSIALVPSPTCHVTSMRDVFPACSTSQPQVCNLDSGKASAPSSVKNAPSPQLVYTDTTSTVFTRMSQLPDQTIGSLPSEVLSSDSKPRRKKAPPFNNTPQNSLAAHCQTETIVAASLPTLASPLALGTCPSYVTSVRDVFPACSTSQPQVGNLDSGKASAPSSVMDAPSPQLVYTDTTSTVFTRMSQLPDQTVASLSSEVPSADSKSRRRKKAQPFNNTHQNSLAAQCQTDTIVASSIPTLASPLALSTSLSYVTTSVRDVFPACSTFQPQVANLDSGKASAPSSVKYAPSPQLVYIDTTSTVFARTPQLPDNTVTVGSLSSEVPSADSKPRRRKTAQLFDNTPQNSLAAQCQTETIVASSLPTLASPLALVTSPSYVATSVSDVFPICSTYQHPVGNLDSGKASACSEETLQKVEYAKLQAEEAAVFAATAITHCQNLWSRLAKQDSRMTREAEAQIAAAAGAAAAAASVAKAAAAAAMVASNAALQAQLMADEAFIPTATGDVAQSENPVSIVHGMGSATPLSVLTADGGTNQSSSILVVAKEAANRRMQPNSAAAKRAENLDSMLEAAKLATEAVSQAGKVVAMGDPLPLKELISAGPEGYWKLPQSSSELVLKSSDGTQERINMATAQGAEISTKEYCGPSGGKISDHGRILPEKPSNGSFDNNGRSAGGISESIGVGKKDPDVGKSHNISDAAQSSRGLYVLHNSSGPGNFENELELSTVLENNIKEGSVVEIYKGGLGFKPAWFSAHVLTLHDGKALIQYRNLLSKEGSNLKEWVALESEGDKGPSIRAALPATALHWQGTRKRRRSAMGNYAWIVGDMVDAWIQDSWCEGVVTEKNDKDETTLTVYFPARGETTAVSAQQLRPSRLWKNGNWVQLSRLSGHDSNNESDMQPEKRPRLKSPFGSNNSEGAELVVGKPEESKLQALSASDIVFNVGKSTKAETKPDARRTLKSGLQREGSRMVCGVPKPGKKRKFVEVNKHFPAAQNRNVDESKDQVKFAKYLMPQGTGRGCKSFSKIDSKDKQSLRVTFLKPRSSSSRTVPQRNNVTNSASSQHYEAMPLPRLDVKKPVVHHEHTSKTATLTERGSSGNVGADKGFLGSSFKKSSLSTKAELPEKGKLVPAGGKLAKIDEVHDDRTDSVPVEVGEPRRSNRRIQPTHRLLEGLESSMIIPKMLSVSHDKGQGKKSSSTGK